MDGLPTILLSSPAKPASLGEIRKNLAGALGFKVLLTNPPDTFIEQLMCSRALTAPSAQNGVLGSYSQPSFH